MNWLNHGPPAAKPPLQGQYATAVVFVVLALGLNTVVTTAMSQELLLPTIAKALHTKPGALAIAETLSNAGYALACVAAVDLRMRLNARPLVLMAESVFVLGSVFAALAGSPVLFITGRVLEGMMTGVLLVAATPVLITNFPAKRLSATVAFVNVGLFGAVTAGPLIAGFVAHEGAWREFFGILAALGVVAIVLELFGMSPMPETKPGKRPDGTALLLALVGTYLTFYGIFALATHPWSSAIVLAPLLIGLLALVTLIVIEYRKPEPLMPVKLISSTLPVAGTLCAMIAGAAYIAAVELLELYLVRLRGFSPLQAGILFWPEVLAIVVASVIFGLLFPTRHLPFITIAGLFILAGAAFVLANLSMSAGTISFLWLNAVLGLGVGLTVAPSLFIAGFGVPSKQIGTAFGLVELLRATATYLIGPVLLDIALAVGKSRTALLSVIHDDFWFAGGLALFGILVLVSLYLSSGARLRPPEIEKWLHEGEQALESPPVADQVRSGSDG